MANNQPDNEKSAADERFVQATKWSLSGLLTNLELLDQEVKLSAIPSAARAITAGIVGVINELQSPEYARQVLASVFNLYVALSPESKTAVLKNSDLRLALTQFCVEQQIDVRPADPLFPYYFEQLIIKHNESVLFQYKLSYVSAFELDKIQSESTHLRFMTSRVTEVLRQIDAVDIQTDKLFDTLTSLHVATITSPSAKLPFFEIMFAELERKILTIQQSSAENSAKKVQLRMLESLMEILLLFFGTNRLLRPSEGINFSLALNESEAGSQATGLDFMFDQQHRAKNFNSVAMSFSAIVANSPTVQAYLRDNASNLAEHYSGFSSHVAFYERDLQDSLAYINELLAASIAHPPVSAYKNTALETSLSHSQESLHEAAFIVFMFVGTNACVHPQKTEWAKNTLLTLVQQCTHEQLEQLFPFDRVKTGKSVLDEGIQKALTSKGILLRDLDSWQAAYATLLASGVTVKST